MLNKKFAPLMAAAVLAIISFTACNDTEKTTDKKTAADSAAISPMRDTTGIDSIGNPKP